LVFVTDALQVAALKLRLLHITGITLMLSACAAGSAAKALGHVPAAVWC